MPGSRGTQPLVKPRSRRRGPRAWACHLSATSAARLTSARDPPQITREEPRLRAPSPRIFASGGPPTAITPDEEWTQVPELINASQFVSGPRGGTARRSALRRRGGRGNCQSRSSVKTLSSERPGWGLRKMRMLPMLGLVKRRGRVTLGGDLVERCWNCKLVLSVNQFSNSE